MNTKEKSKSIRQLLSNLANKLKIPYQNIETEFLLERLVIRLTSDADLFEKLIFKGGYVGLRIYNSNRYTVDLDALLQNEKLEKILEKIKKTVCTNVDDNVWFVFEKKEDLITQGEYGGTKLIFRAGISPIIKNLKKAPLIHLDLGYGDPVTPNPIYAKTNRLIEQGCISWKIYPLETIVAEKLHALLRKDRVCSRAKDIIDLKNFLLKCDPKVLTEAINKTFKHAGTAVPNDLVLSLKNIDTTNLQAGWKTAASTTQINNSFNDYYSEFIEHFSKIFIKIPKD